jgi:hypothetical protein
MEEVKMRRCMIRMWSMVWERAEGEGGERDTPLMRDLRREKEGERMEEGEGRKEALTSCSKWVHRVPDSRKGYSSDEGPEEGKGRREDGGGKRKERGLRRREKEGERIEEGEERREDGGGRGKREDGGGRREERGWRREREGRRH